MSLFGSSAIGADNRRILLTLRCGRMFKDAKDGLIHADPRSGVLTLTMEASGVIDMKWEALKHGVKGNADSAAEGPASESTIIMPGGAKFDRVAKCTTGRVFVVDFTSRQLFYWLQEQPDAERDATTFRALKSAIEGTTRQAAAGAAGRGSTSSAVRPDGAAAAGGAGGGIQLSALTNILSNLGAAPGAAGAGAGASASTAAATTGGARTGGGGGGVSAAQLAAALGNVQQRGPNVRLVDVLRSEPAQAAYRADPALYMSRVHEHLPANTDPSADVNSFEVLHNPEFSGAASVLDSALADPAGYREILHAFGLQPPANAAPSTMGLIQAILAEKPVEQKPAEEKKTDADAAAPPASSSSSDEKK